MTVPKLSRRHTVWVVAAVACAAVLALGVGCYPAKGPRAEVVDEAGTSTTWKTIEYEGVRVDVPAAWQRFDMDDCEFRFERWGLPSSANCSGGSAVAFYGSATFDPAHGPGVRRAKGPGEPPWGGYAYAGDFAVYVTGLDRGTVQRVLKSAR